MLKSLQLLKKKKKKKIEFRLDQRIYFHSKIIWKKKKHNFAVAGDRTRVVRVTGGNTYHYTTTT